MTKEHGWIVRTEACHQPWLRLFCFPYAGGGVALFHRWADYFAALGIDVCPVRLPGREDMVDEPPEVDIRVLARRVAAGLERHLDLRFALFGHSMGALLAYEVARRLREVRLASPSRIIVSACRAPHVPDPQPHVHKLSDEGIVDELVRYGGTPAEVLEDPELLALALPLVRADAQLTEAYRAIEDTPLGSPLSAFHADGDTLVRREDVEAWARYTSAGFTPRLVHGDHFVIQSEPRRVMSLVAEELLPMRSTGVS